jgi:hypothetical protein
MVNSIPAQNSILISRFLFCNNYILVIPTAGRDLISSAVGVPLSCTDSILVILEGSVLSAVRLLL